MYQSRSPLDRNPFSWVLGALLTVFVIYVVAQIAFWLLKLLWWVPLLMIVASVFIDRTVLTGYVRGIGGLFQRRPLYGIAAVILSILAYPLVGTYLLGMALFRKRLKEHAAAVDEQVNGQWTEYEDVTDVETFDLDYEELPPAPEPLPREKKQDNDYDELFK